MNTVDDSDNKDLFLGYIDTDIKTSNTEWSASINMNNELVCFKLDTGAKCYCLPFKIFDHLGLKRIQLKS